MNTVFLCVLCVSPLMFAFAFGANPPPGACTKRKQQACIANATCVNHRCVCNPGLKGDGRFECVENDEHVCQVSADPRDFAYEGARARIYLPCKYRLTWFLTSFLKSNSKLRFCEFEAFSFSKIVNGYNFAGGLEVKVFVYDSGVQQAYQRDFLKFELNAAGISSEGRLLRWGTSSATALFHGTGIVCKFDTVEKFAILDIPECGVLFKFRAYDPSNPVNKQHLMPGLSIKAPANASFTTNDNLQSFPPNVLCGRTSPEDDNEIFNREKVRLNLNKRHQVMLHSILEQRLNQTLISNQSELLPYAGECSNSLQLFQNCPLKSLAVRACSGVVKNKKTVRCLGVSLMAVFNQCLSQVCGGSLCSLNFKNSYGCPVPLTFRIEQKNNC